MNDSHVWVVAYAALLACLAVCSLWLWQSLRALAREEKRLRQMVDQWPEPMLIFRDGRLMRCNQAAVDLVGYPSVTSLFGKSLVSLSPAYQPENQPSSRRVDELRRRALAGDVVQADWMLTRADGRRIWVAMTLAPVYQRGMQTPAVLCAWHDITRQKLFEEQNKLALTVFKNAREAIFITDAQGLVMDINDAYSQITGRSHEQAVGQLPPLPVDEGSSVLIVARHRGVWSGEFVSQRRDGQQRVINLTLSSVLDDQGEPSHFVGVFSDITRQKEAEKQLRFMAHFDALTRLPNRVLFADRLQQAMAQARRHDFQLAVVYIDLDQFKPVNDAFGHDAGDGLLLEVARRMRSILREEDTLARLGGDEFAAVVMNVPDAGSLELLLDRLLVRIAEPVWVVNHSVEISASMGYTLFPQAGDIDGDQLLRQADRAMYQAKREGKNRYCRFQDSAG